MTLLAYTNAARASISRLEPTQALHVVDQPHRHRKTQRQTHHQPRMSSIDYSDRLYAQLMHLLRLRTYALASH